MMMKDIVGTTTSHIMAHSNMEGETPAQWDSFELKMPVHSLNMYILHSFMVKNGTEQKEEMQRCHTLKRTRVLRRPKSDKPSLCLSSRSHQQNLNGTDKLKTCTILLLYFSILLDTELTAGFTSPRCHCVCAKYIWNKSSSIEAERLHNQRLNLKELSGRTQEPTGKGSKSQDEKDKRDLLSEASTGLQFQIIWKKTQKWNENTIRESLI